MMSNIASKGGYRYFCLLLEYDQWDTKKSVGKVKKVDVWT